MANAMECSKQNLFVREMETVSTVLAVWAQDMFNRGFTIDDVKIAVRNAMKICERD